MESENNKKIEEIKKEHQTLDEYFETSKNFYNNLGIELNSAVYNHENNELSFEAVIPKEYQAYENIVHGGAVAALLDTACGVVALVESSKVNKKVMTAELNIKYNKPVLPGEKYFCTGKIDSVTATQVFLTESSVKDKEGVVYATASAKMVLKV